MPSNSRTREQSANSNSSRFTLASFASVLRANILNTTDPTNPRKQPRRVQQIVPIPNRLIAVERLKIRLELLDPVTRFVLQDRRVTRDHYRKAMNETEWLNANLADFSELLHMLVLGGIIHFTLRDHLREERNQMEHLNADTINKDLSFGEVLRDVELLYDLAGCLGSDSAIRWEMIAKIQRYREDLTELFLSVQDNVREDYTAKRWYVTRRRPRPRQQ